MHALVPAFLFNFPSYSCHIAQLGYIPEELSFNRAMEDR
jgi:hypothetical protein